MAYPYWPATYLHWPIAYWANASYFYWPGMTAGELAGIAIVNLTLYARSPSLTLRKRSPSMTLLARSPSMTLPTRD